MHTEVCVTANLFVDKMPGHGCNAYICAVIAGASLNSATATLTLSKIFNWYSSDFGQEGGVMKFISPYLPADIAAFVQAHTVTLQYFSYDWALNGKPPCVCPP